MWCFFLFFFNDTATTEIYTLSLHDALPIWSTRPVADSSAGCWTQPPCHGSVRDSSASTTWRCVHSSLTRSEEHTSELQSQSNLVCRLLLEKKKLDISHQNHLNQNSMHYAQH